ncbi:hypothetical protein BJ508DRAFT_303345 [Ascobolus immersus RN42]|uniref:Uncharacterized protein n=1 Tax=Ascobolus immersus RN42 TaxID=1160509 RepID=A0A3N4ITK5_ASCIM|nr:hypothetical protein BJ508DRAFT_303345 [Ascobolus immersus RN42]
MEPPPIPNFEHGSPPISGQSRIPRRIGGSSPPRAQYDMELETHQDPFRLSSTQTPTPLDDEVGGDRTLRPLDISATPTRTDSPKPLTRPNTSSELITPTATNTPTQPPGSPGSTLHHRFRRSNLSIRPETPTRLGSRASQGQLAAHYRERDLSPASSGVSPRPSRSNLAAQFARRPSPTLRRQTSNFRAFGGSLAALVSGQAGSPRRERRLHHRGGYSDLSALVAAASTQAPRDPPDGERHAGLHDFAEQVAEAQAATRERTASPAFSFDLQEPNDSSTPPGTPPPTFQVPILPTYGRPASSSSNYTIDSFTSHSSAYPSAPSSPPQNNGGFLTGEDTFRTFSLPHQEATFIHGQSSPNQSRTSSRARSFTSTFSDSHTPPFRIFDESDPERSTLLLEQTLLTEQSTLTKREQRSRRLLPTHSRSKSESIVHPHVGAEGHALLRSIDQLNTAYFRTGSIGALDTSEQDWITRSNDYDFLPEAEMVRRRAAIRKQEARIRQMQQVDDQTWGDGPEVRPTMARRQKSAREVNEHYWKTVENAREEAVPERVVMRCVSEIVGNGALRMRFIVGEGRMCKAGREQRSRTEVESGKRINFGLDKQYLVYFEGTIACALGEKRGRGLAEADWGGGSGGRLAAGV